MEGELLKWTNYVSGWQSRWFVLEDQVLSYYTSETEVHLSSKGSLNTSALEISVSSLDGTRFDLTTTSGRVLYLRSDSPEERKQWLDALIASQNSIRRQPLFVTSPYSLLVVLKSDLRMYFDLLGRQVLLLKAAVDCRTQPDLDKMSEATEFLVETCDKFLNTIDSCSKAYASINPVLSERKAYGAPKYDSIKLGRNGDILELMSK